MDKEQVICNWKELLMFATSYTFSSACLLSSFQPSAGSFEVVEGLNSKCLLKALGKPSV